MSFKFNPSTFDDMKVSYFEVSVEWFFDGHLATLRPTVVRGRVYGYGNGNGSVSVRCSMQCGCCCQNKSFNEKTIKLLIINGFKIKSINVPALSIR